MFTVAHRIKVFLHYISYIKQAKNYIMKKIFTLFLFSFIFITAKSQSVVISQIFGGGGNSGAPYLNDYVELFNATSAPVDISGWSVQYANATSATGNWNVTVIPVATTINVGQYFLIKMGSGGAVGAALPTPDLNGTTNMGSTGGRVALLNNSTQLTAGLCPTGAGLIDLVGYGTSTTCFEGTGPTPNASSTNAVFRAGNGCTDTQINSADFTAGPAAPRNGATTPNPCGPPTPLIFANPGTINGLSTGLGVASAPLSFNLSGVVLSPAAGNITVTPSAGLEISLNSGSGFTASPINVPYTASTLTPAVPIYVRIAATAPQGVFTGTVTNSGGTAPNAVVTVNGAVNQNYYSKPSGNLDVLGTWGTATNGSGTAPASFTANYQVFNVVNGPIEATQNQKTQNQRYHCLSQIFESDKIQNHKADRKC